MNFLRGLSKSKKKQFSELDKQEQMDIVVHEITEKVSKAANVEIAKAFVNGTIFANKLLYEKYVVPWDKAKYKEKRPIACGLIEEIRDKYEKNAEKESTDEVEDKEEE